MRKVLLFMHVSLDGFTAEPNGGLRWAHLDDEIFQDAIDLAGKADAALYGRVTYKMMEAYWPGVLTNPASTEMALHHARWVEDIPKIVFSRTLEKTEWNNTRVIRENIAEEVAALKQQPGGNLMIFGSPGLAHSLMELDLIDEYRININPIVLRSGIPLFNNSADRTTLRLLENKTFSSGVIGLHYEVKHN